MRYLLLASAAAVAVAGAMGFGVTGRAYAQAGSYQRSCRNPQNVNGTLTAECADAQGQYHSTSITVAQCRGEIANANGTLTCPGATGTSGPPLGAQGQRGSDFGQRNGYSQRSQGGDDQRGYEQRGGYAGRNDGPQRYDERERQDSRDDRGDGSAAILGALLGGALAGNGGVVAPPPAPPPVYGDPRYGDPRFDWRYQQGGYGYGRRAGEWVPISDRADWLNRQIDRLQRDGAIDFRDARDYRRQLFQIQDRERDYMRRGNLGRRERNDLDRQFNDLTEEIRRDAREQ